LGDSVVYKQYNITRRDNGIIDLLKIHNHETDKVLLCKDVVKPGRILPYCRLSFF